MFEVSGLYKAYDNDVDILKNMNIKVEKGTIHGLFGHNGCGKTTLIKCLNGIFKPDKGVVLLDGESVYENKAVKEKIGYVADSNQFFPGYKIERLIKFYQGMYPKFDRKDFDKLNEVFGLNTKKKVKQLSKGQQMRLAFMLAMAQHPEVMILDEPTSGLDVIAKKNLLDILVTTVENDDMTVIISSHHLTDLEKICDTLTLMKDGSSFVDDEMEGVTGQVKKYQVVFPNGAPKEFYHLEGTLHISNLGSVYTIVLQEEPEGFMEQMTGLGSVFTEEMDCTLEEAFIYLNEEVHEQ